jgi:hypothetical protein
MTKLDKFKAVCRRYLIIKDTSYIDIVFGCIFANRLDSKPVWLYLVGPPGSGKTEVCQALAGPEALIRSTVTRAGLISGASGEGQRDSSLIPKLDGKNLILTDLTTMLTTRRESLHETLGLLRQCYDGYCQWTFGGRKNIKYTSKFGIIACVTHIIDKHHGLLASLGERFLTYRMPDISDYEKTQRSLKAMNGVSTIEQEREMSTAAQAVLQTNPQVPAFSKDYKQRILKVAQVVAKARAEVERDRFTREPEIPRPEVATRLSKQLGDLAIGVAMARNRSAVTLDEVKLIQKAALHSISLKRTELFKVLIPKWPEWISSADIAEIISFKKGAIDYWLEDLLLLKLVERKTILSGKKLNVKAYLWRLKDGRTLKKAGF